MGGIDTAAPQAATARNEAVGMGLGMAGIAVLALIFFPVTLLVILVVRSCEYVPRAIHAVGRWFKAGRPQ
jgi:hypothetical protein